MGDGRQIDSAVISRLRFPRLLALFLALWVLDLFLPDPLRFFDRLTLALGVVIFGLWRERVVVRTAARPELPAMKNVTPRR